MIRKTCSLSIIQIIFFSDNIIQRALSFQHKITKLYLQQEKTFSPKQIFDGKQIENNKRFRLRV